MFTQNEDPLDELLAVSEMYQQRSKSADAAWSTDKFRQGLAKLEQILAGESGKKISLYDTGVNPYTVMAMNPLGPPDLERAQRLYPRLVEAGGSGTRWTQEGLLKAIALAADPASLSFWLSLPGIKRPRDSFAKQRRKLAAAALALLAIRRNEPAAYAALYAMAADASADVRAIAVSYLGQAYLQAERPLAPEALDLLHRAVETDPSGEVRFAARSILTATEQPVSLDNPQGSYAFKVSFQRDKSMYRTIELRSQQTLADLHHAIQRVLEWDDDHLYSFFMSGRLYDESTAFVSPFDNMGSPRADEVQLGALGLTLKQKFLYLFDYGDNHKFDIEVVAVNAEPQPGRFPRVIDKKGEAPLQYPRWEDEEDDDEDLEDEAGVS